MLKMSTGGSKDRFSKKLDKLFWWIVALFPLIFLLFDAVNGWLFTPNSSNTAIVYTRSYANFYTVMTTVFHVNVTSDNIIFDALYKVFGVGGVFPVFSKNSGLLSYIVYFCALQIIHVMVDVLVFIPRLCHKWVSIWTSD